MATKTATGGAWNVAGNWSPSGIPLAADDVIIPTGINQNTPTSATVQCRSLTVDSGATFTGNASATTQIGTSTPGPGNVALSISSGATVTWTAGTIQFVSTSTTQQTISTGGKTIPGLQQSGVGSSYVLLDALTCGAFTLSAGTFDTASYAVTWTSFAHSGAGTKVFSPGSSVITCTSGNTPWSCTGTNFTLSSNTCTIKLTPAVNQATWTTASGSWYNVENNGVGNFLSGALSCENFTYTCDANQTRQVQLSGALTVTGTLTITGNSAINRPSVISSVVGTARTITAAATAISGGVDWRDIAGAGAAAPFVASSGFMGDRLGNSGITMTTPATQTRDATAGQQWGVAARWTSRVPLPQDDVVLGASSGSISGTDVLCLGRSLDFDAYVATLTLTSSSTEYQVHGDVILGAGMTFGSTPNTFYVDYRGRGAQTVTSNGLPLFRATSNQRANFYPVGGSYEFVDDVWIHLSSAGTAVVNHYAGTLDLGAGRSHIIASIASTTTTYARLITAGAGTTMTAPATGAVSIINFSTTNLTTDLVELEIIISTASSNTRTITAGSVNEIGTVTYTVASTGTLAFSASSGHKIGVLNIGDGRTVTATANALLQIREWNGGGSSGARLAVQSATTGTPFWLAILDRPTWDYVDAKDVFGVVQGKLYVGANGTIVSGCTNVHTGAFDPTDPYVRQLVDVSGTAFGWAPLAGNLLVAAVSSTTAAPAWVTPAGYTVIARSPAAGPSQVETYSKIADGSETSFTTTTTGGAVSCKCWEVVGVDTLDLVDHNSASTVTTLDAASAPQATYSGGKTLGIAVWGGNTIGVSGAYTDGYGESRQVTVSSHFRAATRALPAGATTDPNFSWTGNQNPRSQLLVFKATAAAPSTNRGVLTGAAGIGF